MILTSTEQNELHALLRQQGKLTQNDCWDVIEIFEKFILAQPEQIEQEPVAWMYDWNTKGDKLYGNSYYDRVSSDEMAIKRCACDNIRPLYTTPPKPEPLFLLGVLDEIKELGKGDDYNRAFIEGVTYAEKAHGIGGGNE